LHCPAWVATEQQYNFFSEYHYLQVTSTTGSIVNTAEINDIYTNKCTEFNKVTIFTLMAVFMNLKRDCSVTCQRFALHAHNM